MRRYKEFCAEFGIPFLPTSEATLRYFCAEQSRYVAYGTIRVYLAAIRLWHIESGFPDPMLNAVRLRYLCRGIRRQRASIRDSRLPITIPLLKLLKRGLAASLLSSYQKLAYWAAFTLAFYGCLRVSEYTNPPPHSPHRHLLLSDVRVQSALIITLATTKTNQFGPPQAVTIQPTGNSTCPVRAMKKFLLNRTRLRDGPLFQLEDGSHLSRSDINSWLRCLLRDTGVDPSRYSSHSFRIGSATAAAAAGFSDTQIQRLGRWRSDAFRRYIRPTQPPPPLSA